MHKQKENSQQIQLELPDYSEAYYEWKKKQEDKDVKNESVVIIDIY